MSDEREKYTGTTGKTDDWATKEGDDVEAHKYTGTTGKNIDWATREGDDDDDGDVEAHIKTDSLG